jgi:hypothetical protein
VEWWDEGIWHLLKQTDVAFDVAARISMRDQTTDVYASCPRLACLPIRPATMTILVDDGVGYDGPLLMVQMAVRPVGLSAVAEPVHHLLVSVTVPSLEEQ